MTALALTITAVLWGMVLTSHCQACGRLCVPWSLFCKKHKP